MKRNFTLAFIFAGCFLSAQNQPKKKAADFTICGREGVQHVDSMKKCHRITPSDPAITILSFEAIFNTVAGVTIHTTTGDEFNTDMMEHLVKDKPLRIYLNIKAQVNGKEQTFKDIEFQIKHK